MNFAKKMAWMSKLIKKILAAYVCVCKCVCVFYKVCSIIQKEIKLNSCVCFLKIAHYFFYRKKSKSTKYYIYFYSSPKHKNIY